MAGKRYDLLDSIRGLALLSMIGYHGTWDMVNLFGAELSWYNGLPGAIWQQLGCGVFVMLSGFCWSFGRNALKRGLTVFAAGAAVTAVTMIAMPENRVLFGVLTLLGSCMLLLIPLEKLLCRVSPWIGLAGCTLLFLFTQNMRSGTLGFGPCQPIALPEQLYQGWFTTYLGFPHPGFFSADYFPLFPWLFLFLCGYFAHRICKKMGLLNQYFRRGIRSLSALGRHSLPIYLAHQPVLYFCLSLLHR